MTMIVTLEELVAPLSVAEFSQALRTRTLTFRASADRNCGKGLPGWAELRAAIEGGVIPMERVRVTHQERSVPSLLYAQKGKVAPALLARLLDQGASILAEPLEPHFPTLGALCRDVGVRLKEQVRAAAVVTTGSGGAIGRHFDPYDLVVLQVEGSKRWTIHGSPVVDPVEEMSKQEPPQGDPLFDEPVRPGDFLFVPAGYWHHCENGPGLSLHIGIAIRPPAAWHVLQTLLPKLLEEPLYREPLTRRDESEKATHEARVKEALIERIRTLSFADLLREQASTSGRPTPPGDH